MDQTGTRQGYLTEEFRVFHLSDSRGACPPAHYHEFHKLLLLLSGSGYYWIRGQRYALAPGDVVLVGSGCVHRPEFQPGSPYERIIVYLAPDFLRAHGGPELESLFTRQPGTVLRPGQQESRALAALARNLEQELEETGFGSRALCRALLVQLLVKTGRSLEDALSPARHRDSAAAPVIRYLEAHLTEELTVEKVAEACYLSRYHLMHLFRRETGLTLGEYITGRRLMLARELMTRGLPATEACFRCGFGSYSAFSRACSHYLGTTPTGRKTTPAAPDTHNE